MLRGALVRAVRSGCRSSSEWKDFWISNQATEGEYLRTTKLTGSVEPLVGVTFRQSPRRRVARRGKTDAPSKDLGLSRHVKV